MKYSLEFRLPFLPPTINKSQYQHWSVKAKQIRRVKNCVLYAVGPRAPAHPLLRARLTLIRVSSVEPDFDGLVSSFKAVVDGLVAARVLVNDKPANIGQPIYRHEKGPRGLGHIIVRVEEA